MNKTRFIGNIDALIYFLTILAVVTPPESLPPNWKYILTVIGALAGAALTVVKGYVTRDAEESKEVVKDLRQEIQESKK